MMALRKYVSGEPRIETKELEDAYRILDPKQLKMAVFRVVEMWIFHNTITGTITTIDSVIMFEMER